MPRAPKRCAKPDCRRHQPCPIHRAPYAGYRKGEVKGLPSDWTQRRKRAAGYAEKRCQLCGAIDSHGEVDHTIPRSQGGSESPENYRWLCRRCHKVKSDAEKNPRP